ncbi:MAG TPA: hypothetical protein VLE93_01190 [Candidatus Saccharimonadales bacterium]|nr:hypothetical protein [Candidatus Saccharimonadales bacterium]
MRQDEETLVKVGSRLKAMRTQALSLFDRDFPNESLIDEFIDTLEQCHRLILRVRANLSDEDIVSFATTVFDDLRTELTPEQEPDRSLLQILADDWDAPMGLVKGAA